MPALLGWWRRDPATPRDLDFLHPPDRFRDILEVERMRSDRTRLPFSLLVFTLPKRAPVDAGDGDGDADGGATERLRFVRLLERRRRATDHVGEMHDRHLGVVLWNTTEAGATAYAHSVLEHWDGDWPEFDVYLYPTFVPPGAHPPSGPDVAEGERDGESGPAGDADAGRVGLEAKPLEMLFVRPLPWWKRAIDVVGAGLGLLVLSPLLLAVAALVKWTSPGPVLFAQTRTGHGGRSFTIYKFRTMVANAAALKDALRDQSEQDGPAFKLARDPRITPVGRILRKSCIDELPQLWNVLVGDMTLVGPRPLEIGEANRTSGWERRRLDVTPGLTCIWQVEGKSKVTFAEWMRMDIRYARVRSFWHDASLVLRTLLAMLRLRASQ